MVRRRALLSLLVALLLVALAQAVPATTTTPGFILCTCQLCVAHPDVICQVSPSGFSIHCYDWAAQHCPATTTS